MGFVRLLRYIFGFGLKQQPQHRGKDWYDGVMKWRGTVSCHFCGHVFEIKADDVEAFGYNPPGAQCPKCYHITHIEVPEEVEAYAEASIPDPG